MLTFGIDWDDVISPLNDCAIELANEEYHFEPPLTLEDIDSWENTGRASVIKKYYSDPRLYEMQQVSDQAKAFIRTLQTKGIVYIVTAVQPQFMSKRVEQIKTAFPDFPDENIIMGFQKSVVQVDITLDDGPHNILKSSARFPVLMRRPWNRELTGLLAVHNYEEFFQLLDQIKSAMIEDRVEPAPPCIVALVGPSGSGKMRSHGSCVRPADSRYREPIRQKVYLTVSILRSRKKNLSVAGIHLSRRPGMRVTLMAQSGKISRS